MASLMQGALAERGFFHLGAHYAEIVRGGNHGEENHQHASEGEEALQGTELARSDPPPPQPIGGNREQQPSQIEQQFHEIRTGVARAPEELVFQKLQMQVNVTSVLGGRREGRTGIDSAKTLNHRGHGGARRESWGRGRFTGLLLPATGLGSAFGLGRSRFLGGLRLLLRPLRYIRRGEGFRRRAVLWRRCPFSVGSAGSRLPLHGRWERWP